MILMVALMVAFVVVVALAIYAALTDARMSTDEDPAVVCIESWDASVLYPPSQKVHRL